MTRDIDKFNTVCESVVSELLVKEFKINDEFAMNLYLIATLKGPSAETYNDFCSSVKTSLNAEVLLITNGPGCYNMLIKGNEKAAKAIAYHLVGKYEKYAGKIPKKLGYQVNK